MKDGTGRLPASQASDSRISGSVQKLLAKSGSLGGIDGTSVDHVEIGGQPMQMVVSSFKNRRNLDWLVVTLVPDSDFLAGVQKSRTQSMLIGAAAVLAAIGVGILMAMWLLNPILAVVGHARRVGGGDLDARIARRDNLEITQLSTALNDMADGLKDRMKLRHALDLAMEVQQTLLPSNTPRVPGLDIAARSKYCEETGGDYYDYLDVEGMGPHSLMIALGDVAGHGIAAAMLMATARGVLRSQVRTQGSLGKLLTHVNEHLAADTRGDRFMTMFLAVLDASTMSMRWASAGHDQPLIYDPESGLLTEIDPGGGGLPLGVSASEEYEELTYTQLRSGQVMLVGTDGLWEARNNDGELFGKSRVGEALAATAHLSAADIEAAIYTRLQTFCNGRSNDDDITYVVIKFSC
jgi:sigma-B regulation protein RsbU (phosphoserine phosphatase)